jgi:UDP-N-acetylmuramate dehydrogenase
MKLNILLKHIQNIEIKENVNLATLTTFKLQGLGNLIIVHDINSLVELVTCFKQNNIKYRMIGWGANQVLSSDLQEVLIKLEFSFDSNYFDQIRSEYNIPASVGLNQLTSHALKFGLIGWEVLTGIPASLGGAIYMNAGTALGEISSILKSVTILKADGSIVEHLVDKNSFSYRKNYFVEVGDVIVSAKILNKGTDPEISKKINEYLSYRKSTQPLSTKNCGCVFKNPKPYSAGALIDLMGLKGIGINGLKVSNKHANFMENDGKANAEDFHQLVKLINTEMMMNFGIEFELEVKV